MVKPIESIKKPIKTVVQISEKASFQQSIFQISFFETEPGKYGLDIVSTCSRPYYFARLSGPSLIATQRMRHYNYSTSAPLVMMELDDVIYRHGDSSLQYLDDNTAPAMMMMKHVQRLSTLEFFSVHHAGTYFLEILHIACNATDESLVSDCLPNTVETLTLNAPFQIELKALPTTTTTTTTTQENTTTTTTTGVMRWTREKESKVLDRAITTRIQNTNSSSCNTCSNDWFNNYTLHLPHLVDHPPDDPHCTVCLIGASHSRHMALAMNVAFQERQPACHAVHFDIKFPQEYDNLQNNVTKRMEHQKCTDVIVAMGQWALSWKNGKNFQSRKDFQRHMVRVVDSFHRHFPETRFTLRSLHYHPLSNIILSCKPTDWRSPMLTDAYNEVLMQIADHHEAFRRDNNSLFRFVDTSEMVRPVWDTPDDWSHYSPKVGVEEAIFLLNQIWDPSPRQLSQEEHTRDEPQLDVQHESRSLSIIGSLCVLLYLMLGRKSRERP